MSTLFQATGHGFVADDAVVFGNCYPDPYPLVEGHTYYVLATDLDADNFRVSDTIGGTAITLAAELTSFVVSKVFDGLYAAITDPADVMAPPEAPAAPTALALTSDVIVDADGHQIVRVKAAFTDSTSDGVLGTRVELTYYAGPDWTKAHVLRAPLGVGFVQFTVPGNVTVYARAYAENVYGQTSVATGTESITSSKDSTAPGVPTGLTVMDGVLGISALWTSNTEPDLSHYELLVDDDSGFGSPTTIKLKASLIQIVPLTPGTFYVKVRAVDTSGNASAYCASGSAVSRLVDTADLDPAAIINQATNLINGTATITIDDAGLHITDGALFLEDEFGSTVLTASGFSGSWTEYIRLGLYNARFSAGVAGTIPNGRTAALPYWLVANDVGSPVATFLDPGVKVTFAAVNNVKSFRSDPIPMSPGAINMDFGIAYEVVRVAGSIKVEIYFEVSDDPGFAFTSESLHESRTWGSSSGAGQSITGFDNSLTSNVWARLVIEITELTAHDAGNYCTINAAWLRTGPYAVGDFYAGGGALVVAEASDPAVLIATVGGSIGLGVIGDVVVDTANLRIWDGKVIIGTSGPTEDVYLRRSAAKTLVIDTDGDGADLTEVDIEAAKLTMPTTAYISGVKAPVVNVYGTSGSPHTWTKPTGIHHIVVEVVGGGGAGGGAATTAAGQSSGGVGGSGGGYAKKTFSAADLAGASSFTATTGAGGTGVTGNNGNNGNASTFAGTGISTVTGGAGQGGGFIAAGTGLVSGGAPAGGAGSNGDVNANGQGGGGCWRIAAAHLVPGYGGGTVLGGGVQADAGSANRDAYNGNAYGGGGAGASNGASQGSTRKGGNGADGVVIVTEFYGP